MERNRDNVFSAKEIAMKNPRGRSLPGSRFLVIGSRALACILFLFVIFSGKAQAQCAITSATLTMNIDDTAHVWLNGNYVGKLGFRCYMTGQHCYKDGLPSSISIPPSYFSTDGRNVLAVGIDDVFAGQVFGAWELAITCADGKKSFHTSNETGEIVLFHSGNGSATPTGSGGGWYSPAFTPTGWVPGTVVPPEARIFGVPIFNSETGKRINPLSHSATASAGGFDKLYFRHSFVVTPIAPPQPPTLAVTLSTEGPTENVGADRIVFVMKVCNSGKGTSDPVTVALNYHASFSYDGTPACHGYNCDPARPDQPNFISGGSNRPAQFVFPAGMEGNGACVEARFYAKDYFIDAAEICTKRSGNISTVVWNDGIAARQASSNEVIISMKCETVKKPRADPVGKAFFAPDLPQVGLTCETAGAIIRYTLDGSEPSESSPVYQGRIPISATTTLKAKGFKGGLPASETLVEVYTKVVRKVDMPKALPTPAATAEFDDSLRVTLSVDTPFAQIIYTIDGSDPRIAGSKAATGVVLMLKGTTTIRAIGVKANCDTSDVLVASFARRAPGIRSACYKDLDGDGLIETAVVEFDALEGGLAPVAVRFQDPFSGNAETTLQRAAAVVAGTRVTYTFVTPFAFGTFYTPGVSGPKAAVTDSRFQPTPFAVQDSTGPVVTGATYQPAFGAGDTLVVQFSENVQLVNNGTVRPFTLWHGTQEYSFDLELTKGSGTGTLTFLVKTTTGIEYPYDGDSMRIAVSQVRDIGGTVQLAPRNRACAIRVKYPQAAKPVADPAGSEFLGAITVHLTSPELSIVRIYYTTDTMTPLSSFRRYDGIGISIDRSTTVRAYAVGDRHDTSTVMVEFYRRKPASARYGYYLDADADGKIDSAVVVFDTLQSARPNEVRFFSPLSDGRAVTVPISQSLVLSPQSVGYTIAPAFERVTGFTTGKADIPGDPEYSSAVFAMYDSVAPVIESATYRPGRIVDENRREADTLVVVFTEESALADAGVVTPFVAQHNGTPYSLYLSLVSVSENRMVFSVDSLEGILYPFSGDELYIDSAKVRDSRGNIQNNPNNRRARLDVVFPPLTVEIVVGPNPFTPSNGALPPEILSALRASTDNQMTSLRSGIVILIKANERISGQLSAIDGTLLVYDNLGNPVSGKLPIVSLPKTNSRMRNFFVWDARNNAGRLVGSGTYLGVVKFETTEAGQKTQRVERVKIGVKR